jgi:hypothetical protein
MPGRTFLLISHERSGSHLAGDFVNSLANFRMIDEVCNPDAVRPGKYVESLHRFKYDYLIGDPGFMLEPTRPGHSAFVASFFAHLAKLRAPNDVVVDIKYGHVHNFEWWWCPPLVRPFLFNFCQENDTGIIHLYRENVIEATVSGMIADRRKIWHSWQVKPETEVETKFPLPVREVMRRAALLQQQTKLFKDWTGGTRKIEITYEEIAAHLGKGGETDAKLTAFLGSKLKNEFKPRHQKVTRPVAEIVENFDELRMACAKDGLGWCLP